MNNSQNSFLYMAQEFDTKCESNDKNDALELADRQMVYVTK